LAKRELGATNVNYLGYRLTPEGILPGLDKKAVRDSKPLSTLQEIKQFISLCNFSKPHVRNFAAIGTPPKQTNIQKGKLEGLRTF
jgi:hypothetical protein